MRRMTVVVLAMSAALWVGCGEEPTNDPDTVDPAGLKDTSTSSGEPEPDASFGSGDDADALPDPEDTECSTNADCADLFTDIDTCQIALCDAGKGRCKLQARKDYEQCDDSDSCTEGSVCLSGACVGGQNIICNDDNPCTDDACTQLTGCTHTPNSGSCTDGNPCTQGDTCQQGACVAGPSQCPCTTTADCEQFDDQNPCNGVLACSPAGACVVAAGTIVVCDEQTTGCLASACSPETGDCIKVPVADGEMCTDGDACTTGDRCIAGACEGTGALTCASDNQCILATCKPDKGCQTTNISGPCDDQNPCTSNDQCSSGICVGEENACICESDLDCAAQDDDDLCNGAIGCVDGFCDVIPGTKVTCPAASGPCMANECQPASGACVEAPLTNGAACSDANPCTSGDTCIAGQCTGAPIAGCGGCSSDGECADDDPCTTDTCNQSGQCLHTPVPDCTAECSNDKDCDDGNACTIDACNTGNCTSTPIPGPCNDGNACTTNDQCNGGACLGGAPLACNDGNPCTADACNPASGCTSSPVGGGCCSSAADCNDGFACTNDTCVNGKCTNTAITCADSTTCGLAYCQQGVCTTATGPNAAAGVAVYQESFDDGQAQAWKFTSKNTETYWSVQSQRSFSAPSSLYGGKPNAWSYDFGTSDMLASLPPVDLPIGQLTLRFRYWADLHEETCFADILYVGINGQSQKPFVCESSDGVFLTREYDISSFGGQVAFISFFFQTYDATENVGEGVYVDDVSIIAKPSASCQ